MIIGSVLANVVIGRQDPPTLVDFRRMLEVDVIKAMPRFDLGDEVIAFPVAGVSYSAEVTRGGSVMKSVPCSPVDVPAFGKFLILRPQGDAFVEITEPGDYSYRLKSGDLVLKQLDFKVSQENSSDPYNPSSNFVIEGPWRSIGYLANNANRPDDALNFDCYSHLGESKSATAQQFSVSVLKAGAVVAQSRPYVLSKEIWELQSVPLWKPDNKNYFKNADLMALNADFEIVVKHGSQRVKSFKGSTAGKAFKNLPEANNGFRPSSGVLLPKSLMIPGGSVGKAFLVDVYWMKAN